MIVSFDDGLLAVLLSTTWTIGAEFVIGNETIGFIDGFIEFSYLDFKKIRMISTVPLNLSL